MYSKTQWSDLTTTTAASETDSRKLSAEWIRDRWNQLRKPEVTRPPSRPSSSCCATPGRSMHELTSLNAFHEKMAELQCSVGEGSLLPLAKLAAAQEGVQSPAEARPCAVPAANISAFGPPGALPPPPDFDPPEFRSLCLQQDARARAQTGGLQW